MDKTATAPILAAFSLTSALILTACASRPAPPAPAAPAPLPARATLEKIAADGLFAFGQASIDPGSEAAASLDALAARLAASPQPLRALHVIGHSDRIGSARANLALSTRRAEAVRDYLLARGVRAGVVTAVGRGSVEPLVECSSERGAALVDCLAPNRRVDIRIGYGDPATP